MYRGGKSNNRATCETSADDRTGSVCKRPESTAIQMGAGKETNALLHRFIEIDLAKWSHIRWNQVDTHESAV